MGVILTGIVAAVLLAVGAGFVLRGEQELAWEVYSSPTGARVGDPGHNLVGENWTGEADGSPAIAEGEETPG